MSRDSSADPIVHREKIWISVLPRNLCVARPVGRAEIDRTLAVKKAMQKEWDRLRSKYVLDEDHPRQWDVVGGLPVALLLTCRSLAAHVPYACRAIAIRLPCTCRSLVVHVRFVFCSHVFVTFVVFVWFSSTSTFTYTCTDYLVL